ncbi:MAG: glycosyltransferase WbuB [Hydrogenothermus sp.]|nr:MAG: glycosyltransferase WbuB [Hydrogenothermus sp.]
MKTIWIINEYAGSIYHGMEYRHYYIGKELVKRGYKVYIISASHSHVFIKQPNVKESFKSENIDGINYLWVKVPKYNHSHDKKRVLKWFIFTLKTYFSLPINLLKKPDIIIVSPMATFPIVSGYKWAKKFNAKLIYEVKDIWPLTLVELGGYSLNHPFIKLMEFFEKFAYKKADKVVSVLTYAYKHMEKQGLDIDKFVYIPNGICLEDYKEIENAPKEVLDRFPKNKFVVIYAGTFGKANALEYLIKAADILKEYKDIHFVLVGKGMEEENLKSLVRKLNSKNITFLPPVSKKQIQDLLKRSDVCYIGLKNETIFKYGVSPNKLFDYMYSEKPILYAINSGNNIIKDANCGISVEAENPKSIAEGVLKLYKMSNTEREILGRNGKKHLLKYHTYKVITDKFEEIFND